MQSNDILRHSDATKQCAAHSGVRTAARRNGAKRRNSSAFGCNTQYATHSGVRTAEQRNSSAFGCDKGNAQPTAARQLRRDDTSSAFGCNERSEILQRSDLTISNTQPTAARALQRDKTSSAFGCDERNAQPTAAYALRSNEIA